MGVGPSHRIVIEIDPAKKEQLYAALKARGLTMREWFIATAERELLNKTENTKTHG